MYHLLEKICGLFERKQLVAAAEKPVYVISDLHIGSGGPRDTLNIDGKRNLLEAFLDHVQREDGELIILGDMIDLWRFGLISVVKNHRELLDRLSEMDVTYIPGNHDQCLASIDHADLIHPFFDKLQAASTRIIGDKQFRFYHGHELDPVNGRIGPYMGKALGLSAGLIEWAKGAQVFSSEIIGEALLEMAENILTRYYTMTQDLNLCLCGELCLCNGLGARKPLKTRHEQNMLKRHNMHRLSNGHDIVVSAHTHRPGVFGGWYYNSGSWTGNASTFLRIMPDATTQLFDWTTSGPRNNNTVFCS